MDRLFPCFPMVFPEKNGKTGILGHFMLVCCLLWFLMLLFNVRSWVLTFFVSGILGHYVNLILKPCERCGVGI